MFPSVAFNPLRLLVVCAAITTVAVAAAYFGGHLMVGVFFGVGLLLGLLNALLVRRSVASITAKEHPMKSTMALNSATRLAIITVIGLVIAYIFRPAGLGVVFGLALFQVVLVLSTALPVWKKLRAGDWAESASEGTERGNTSDE
ncbi:ATP synthase I [Mycobacterium triplex]|uniref:ATP synthase I n=1 Tax=Mycobacterium triplex TaxID=47839 RepID=A0A024K2W7_9MYCO|nr:ATP synthase I [Mycobacterium triplex]